MAHKTSHATRTRVRRGEPPAPWNKGRQVGRKPALKPSEVRAIRQVLKSRGRLRDRVLFDLAIDSKLRGCDLVALQRQDIASSSGEVRPRTSVRQSKTGRPVLFEVSAHTRRLLSKWLSRPEAANSNWLFPSDRTPGHITTRQYARLVDKWVQFVGLDPSHYGTHSLRRTKAAHIYRKTRDIRSIQILLGHSSLEQTVRYLGVEIEDALALSEKYEL
jgi:integrase